MPEWEDLVDGGRVFVQKLAYVQPGEEVLVITDVGRPIRIAEAVATAAREAGAKTMIIIRDLARTTAEEPPKALAEAMRNADVAFLFLTYAMAHTDARRVATAAGTRILSCTGIVEETLLRGPIKADFEAMEPVVHWLRSKFHDGQAISITAPSGTDLRGSIAGRRGGAELWARRRGEYSGAPSIEVNVSPVEGTAEGSIVVDGSAAVVGLVRNPIHIAVRAGRAIDIEGAAEAARLREVLETTGTPESYLVAEIGVGLNPEGRITGNMMEDESTLGTAHIALGNNISFGGSNRAPTHLDMVIRQPTITVDGEVVVENGAPKFPGHTGGQPG